MKTVIFHSYVSHYQRLGAFHALKQLGLKHRWQIPVTIRTIRHLCHRSLVMEISLVQWDWETMCKTIAGWW